MLLVGYNSSSVRNNVIDPFCTLDGKTYTPVRGADSKPSVPEPSVAFQIRQRMEQIISIDLGVPVQAHSA